MRPWSWLWKSKESVGSFVAALSQLLQRLCDAEVDFVVVGGFAALLHGSTLVTRDLDICAVLSKQHVAKLREVLRDLNPKHRLTSQKLCFLANPEPDVDVRNLYLETEMGTVDILSSILGVGDFERVRAASIEIELFGRRCRVISLEDLIRAKEALGREKDLLAVKELRAIREKQK
ncbi:MAG: nucleotidyltransferase [Steroidobacteraceae bacterium]